MRPGPEISLDLATAVPAAPAIIAAASGRFGPLSVIDTATSRELWCGELCQGACYLDPPGWVQGRAVRPGPVPDASYVLGWLVPAVHRPTARVLMAGLGSGAGVSALLHHFPAMRITVAEADPTVTAMALAHFPLLAAHVDAGHCVVVTAGIDDLAQGQPQRHFDFALLDAFAGDAQVYVPDHLLLALAQLPGGVWINAVDDGDGAQVTRVTQALLACGLLPRVAATTLDMSDGTAQRTDNVLVGTGPVDAGTLNRFRPFADLDHPRARQIQAAWRAMLDLPWAVGR